MYGTLEVGRVALNCKVSRYLKESNHRYKQKIEKDYIIEQMKSKQQEKKAKQDEKVQEVH
jgi:hypothetical protein